MVINTDNVCYMGELSETRPTMTSYVRNGELAPVLEDPLGPLVEGWLRLFPETTRKAYAGDLGRWRQYLAERGGTMFGARHVHFLDWAASLRDLRMTRADGRQVPYAQTTRARWESSVTSFYDYCRDVWTDQLEAAYGPLTSPAHVKGSKFRTRPGAPAHPTPALTGGQLRRLLAAAAARGAAERRVTQVLFVTGCRIAELLRANVGDLHWEAGTAYVSITRKGDKPARLRLPARVAQDVAAGTEGRPFDDPLIVDASGKRLTPGRVEWMLEAASKVAKIRFVVTPHVLRTTAINLTIDRLGLQFAQQLAGHAHLSTTEIYMRRLHAGRDSAQIAAVLGDMLPLQGEVIAEDDEDDWP